jgi:hypothetical protein
LGKKDIEKIMAITTSASVGALVGTRPKRRTFKLKTGGTTMAMRGGRKMSRGGKKKKKNTNRGGRRRK